jgi:hypothetical protein
MSNRIQKRLSRKTGRNLMKLGWNEFEDITDTSETKTTLKTYYKGSHDLPYQIWKNNLFIVQVFKKETEWGLLDKAMIRRNDEKSIHSWQAIQRIKNEIFGKERTALEVYPKESKLVDMANLYWLWVLPEDCNCPIEV